MAYFFYFALFIFGLAFGSFLNVISLRYQPCQKLLDKKKISGRSHCLVCDKQLAWHDLIPIFSFFFLRGKCRHCDSKISFQYPLVEILSGLIFVFVPFALYNLFIVHNSYFIIQVFLWLLVFLLFLLFSIIDFRHYIIPDQINLALAILGIMLIVLNSNLFSQWSMVNNQQSFLGHYAMLFNLPFFSILNSQFSIFISHIFAAIIAMLFFGAIIVLSRGKAMGCGDFKLAGALGLIFGWPDILMVLFLAFIIGAAFGTVLLIKKIKKIKEVVPFGPFLAIGACLTFFSGYQIINGYFRLFGL